MPKNPLYDTQTPWDILLDCVNALEQHASAMEKIILANNTQQNQTNRLIRDIQNLNKRITQLERQLHEIG